MINICIFAVDGQDFSSFRGGVGRIINILKLQFEEKGCKVFFITNKPKVGDAVSDNVFYLPDLKVDSENNIIELQEFISRHEIDIFINELAYSLECINLCNNIKHLTKIINVHNNCIKCIYDSYPQMFKRSKNKIIVKLVDTFNMWFLIKYLFKLRSKYIWKKAINVSDFFVVYFDSFKKEFEELYGIKSNKIKVITNPSTYDDLSSEIDFNLRKNIVYVGRIVETQKRFEKVIQLWHKLHDEFKDWSFDVVGEGPYLDKAIIYANENKLDRVHFHGLQDPLKFWLNADIFTLTSDFEGFGMVLIEAQSCGTVPITFDCFSAINEVVNDEHSGIIVKDFKIDEMYHKIKSLINNEDKILRLKKNGLIQAKKFDKDLISDKWMKLFDELLSSKKP
ncbi:glycosyltransferase [Flavobacterium sp.]|uniref:glycosyltransferase n=4 Tax=Flavobacterium sp. TaxID=239 RepID=UPI00404841BD